MKQMQQPGSKYTRRKLMFLYLPEINNIKQHSFIFQA